MTASTPNGPVRGPLADLSVVELQSEAGAFAGKLLADMGADVVSVEPPGGAATRDLPPFLDDDPHPERSLHFWHYNLNKRAVTLDWTRPAGRDLLLRLLDGADALLEAAGPGALAAHGLNDDALRADRPGLIHVSMTAFGRDGPRAHEQATDLTLLAGGGPAWSCGYDDHALPPVAGGGYQGYQTACHFAVMGLLTALLHRDAGGPGQRVDVNMHAANNVTTEAASIAGTSRGRPSSGRPAATPPSSPRRARWPSAPTAAGSTRACRPAAARSSAPCTPGCASSACSTTSRRPPCWKGGCSRAGSRSPRSARTIC